MLTYNNMPCMQYALPVTDGPVLSPAPPPAEDPEHECGGEEEAGAQDGGDQRQQQQLSRARTCKCVSVLGHCYLLYNVATSSADDPSVSQIGFHNHRGLLMGESAQ